jgi:ribulose-5-phosphate 4-epimerase/fuculose-1-phosphate aldolase
MALSALKWALLPITQTSMRFLHIGYHDYHGVVLDVAERDSLVSDLGDNNALIFRNHSSLTVGKSIPEAFNAMHRLELSCKSQLAAMTCNTELNPVPATVLDETYMNYQPQTRRHFGLMEWPALLRKVDHIDPDHA